MRLAQPELRKALESVGVGIDPYLSMEGRGEDLSG